MGGEERSVSYQKDMELEWYTRYACEEEISHYVGIGNRDSGPGSDNSRNNREELRECEPHVGISDYERDLDPGR